MRAMSWYSVPTLAEARTSGVQNRQFFPQIAHSERGSWFINQCSSPPPKMSGWAPSIELTIVLPLKLAPRIAISPAQAWTSGWGPKGMASATGLSVNSANQGLPPCPAHLRAYLFPLLLGSVPSDVEKYSWLVQCEWRSPPNSAICEWAA